MLEFVSCAPPLRRYSAAAVLAAGALLPAAKVPPAAAASFQLAVPAPTKSTRPVVAAYVGVPPVMAVETLRSATLKLSAAMAAVPVAWGVGNEAAWPAGTEVPMACWTSR